MNNDELDALDELLQETIPRDLLRGGLVGRKSAEPIHEFGRVARGLRRVSPARSRASAASPPLPPERNARRACRLRAPSPEGNYRIWSQGGEPAAREAVMSGCNT